MLECIRNMQAYIMYGIWRPAESGWVKGTHADVLEESACLMMVDWLVLQAYGFSLSD